MSKSTSETIVVKYDLVIVDKDGLENKEEINIVVDTRITTYDCYEFYGEERGDSVTEVEALYFELEDNQDLTDEQYKEYEKITMQNIQDLVNEL